MKWKPISEAEIIMLINDSYERMNFEQRRFWDAVKIYPEKWKQKPWGNKGKGFWVVAIIGNSVVYYNDIEEGFNRSCYIKYGEIKDYYCNQSELEWEIQVVMDEIRDGYPSGYKAGPPIP
ncbi:hypothetical protein [Breznakiella homolactica]|uniref:Uncharacterized protein n=1 Tax=Breznakiella homolactica TaxID=2798577 RepID=A0A7T7XJZ9_9SPIR|nr:hypothetical protein [Breznakiella homolactica]QQO07705.1 hypothetical protein JFL75_12200 [Breznakiella homolactica]